MFKAWFITYHSRYLMKVCAGIDLHANNNYLGVVAVDGKRLFCKKLRNDPGMILNAFVSFRQDVVGVVVESTFNWYWLGAVPARDICCQFP